MAEHSTTITSLPAAPPEALPEQKTQTAWRASGPDVGRTASAESSGWDAVYDQVFPAEMTGKSVLDVRAGDGSLCLEALRRGAQRAVGLDLRPEIVAQAQRLAKTLKRPAEFSLCDIDRDLPRGPFDVVLCLQGLEYARNPFAVLDRLIDLATERLVIAVGNIGTAEQKQLRLRRWRRWLFRALGSLPAVFVNPHSHRASCRHFFVSVDALTSLLKYRRSIFARVDVIASPQTNSHLLVAHRRRIERLLVVAGPTASGKTTLVNRLADGQLPELAAQLGLNDRSTWESLDIYQIAADQRTHLATVVSQYDFLARLKWGLPDDQMTDLLDCLRCAERVELVTLWTEPARLREQFEENEFREYFRQHGHMPGSRKNLRLREDYKDPQNIIDYYNVWFQFAGTVPASHYVLTQFPQFQFDTLENWRSQYPPAVTP